MQRLVLVVALIAVGAEPALACPPGRPCTKYDQMKMPVADAAAVTSYTRASRGLPPPTFSVKAITSFLLNTTWEPRYDRQTVAAGRAIAPSTIVFREPAAASNSNAKVRTVLVRQIEKRGASIIVAVDADAFELKACTDKPKHACLYRRTDVTFAQAAATPGNVDCANLADREAALARREAELAKREAAFNARETERMKRVEEEKRKLSTPLK